MSSEQYLGDVWIAQLDQKRVPARSSGCKSRCNCNCRVFATPHKLERQLTAESAKCWHTLGNSHLPRKEAPARTTGEPDMWLWTWHAPWWVPNGVRIVPAWCDHDVACQWRSAQAATCAVEYPTNRRATNYNSSTN